MIVSQKNVGEVCEKLKAPGIYAIDTETTGLDVHGDDKFFSIIVAGDEGSFYFNFIPYDGLDPLFVLERAATLDLLQEAFDTKESTWIMHNAKFDYGMLEKENAVVNGELFDTVVGGRIAYNRHPSYAMDYLAKEIGEEKLSTVEDYIKEHDLYDAPKEDKTYGSKKKKKGQPRYDLVPFEIISEYGLKDAEITLKLYKHQLALMNKLQSKITSNSGASVHKVCHNEMRLIRTLARIEKAGFPIDRGYTERAYYHELGPMEEARAEYKEISGQELVDSGKSHAKAFEAAGMTYPRTLKGNPSFTEKVLAEFDNPLAECIRKFRKAEKKAHTYYANFLNMADDNDRIHCNLHQSGTDTGRMSCSKPNLQNVPKEEDPNLEYIVRRCFVPPPDHCLVMIDYDQMEYRLMLDYADEKEIIKAILDDGLDVHQATADLMGVSRTAAKTLNFMILYGGGLDKLAAMLGITWKEAKHLRSSYFRQLKRVKQWSRAVIQAAEDRGYVINWAGRFCHQDRGFEYRAPNHLIQGGCADVVKFAMNDLDDYLSNFRSQMLLQVHDEIVFDIHPNELGIIPTLKEIMENAYPYKRLPMTCGVDHSWISWGDKVKGLPDAGERPQDFGGDQAKEIFIQ